MPRVPLIFLSALVLFAAVAAGVLWNRGDLRTVSAPTEPAQTPAAPDSGTADVGGPFALTDQFGVRRTDADFRGKFMLVFFGYTFCPDVCPTTLAIEAEALDKLGAPANRIAPIFITVDPKRDTQEKLKAYLASFDARPAGARPNFVGMTGSDSEIAETAKAYRVYYQAHLDGRTENGADYSIDHTGNIYLMSPEGKFVAYYSQGILADEMAADLMRRLSAG
jgi:protein SCO1/2